MPNDPTSKECFMVLDLQEQLWLMLSAVNSLQATGVIVTDESYSITKSSPSTLIFTGSPQDWQLPSGAEVPAGTIWRIWNYGSTLTLNSDGSDTISELGGSDGLSNVSISTGTFANLVWDGSVWRFRAV